MAAAILTILVVAFVVYLVGELRRPSRGTPDLRITDPAADVVAWQGDEYTIRGVTEPNSTITTDGLRQNPSTTADAEGAFSVRVGPGSRRERHHPRRQRPADRPRQRRGAPHDHGGAAPSHADAQSGLASATVAAAARRVEGRR